jgi:hypothetical protein
MNADWYYLKRRWFGGSKKIGPLHEHELLHRIDLGEITPDTLVMSSKTRQHWVKMSEVAPAMAHWKLIQHSSSSHAGHATHGHDSHGHGSHGHESHGHGSHGHESHGHGSHGYGSRGHDSPGHGP